VKRLILRALRIYKKFTSPMLERVFGKACRFTPTCSEYTIEALEKFGTKKGLVLGIKRFAKCHPWGGSGWDPVPGKIN
jgi:putative membrane protein insertion efficiency factor